MRTLENALRRVGFARVAGCDEVGRGCLAGPVVAAAVVLHPDKHIAGVCDSKLVPADERERLFERIVRHAVAWAVAAADPREIDHINIHQASLRAMQRAVLALVPLPDMVLVDAFRVPDLPMAQRGVPHGDRRCSAIARPGSNRCGWTGSRRSGHPATIGHCRRFPDGSSAGAARLLWWQGREPTNRCGRDWR